MKKFHFTLSIVLVLTLLFTMTLPVLASQITIDDWTWTDAHTLTDNTLTLPEAHYFKSDVVSKLPASIMVMSQGESRELNVGWDCSYFPQEGASQGVFYFFAQLPQGLERAESCPQIFVRVIIGRGFVPGVGAAEDVYGLIPTTPSDPGAKHDIEIRYDDNGSPSEVTITTTNPDGTTETHHETYNDGEIKVEFFTNADGNSYGIQYLHSGPGTSQYAKEETGTQNQEYQHALNIMLIYYPSTGGMQPVSETRYEYDADNRVISTRNTYNEYDADDNAVSTTEYLQYDYPDVGSSEAPTVNQLDVDKTPQGSITDSNVGSEIGAPQNTTQSDEDGNLYSVVTSGNTQLHTRMNTSGQVLSREERTYFTDDNVGSGEDYFFVHTEYTYDESGKLIQTSKTTNSTEAQTVINRTYNSDGSYVDETYLHDTHYSTSSFDANGVQLDIVLHNNTSAPDGSGSNSTGTEPTPPADNTGSN